MVVFFSRPFRCVFEVAADRLDRFREARSVFLVLDSRLVFAPEVPILVEVFFLTIVFSFAVLRCSIPRRFCFIFAVALAWGFRPSRRFVKAYFSFLL
jgi:hypothetical protein